MIYAHGNNDIFKKKKKLEQKGVCAVIRNTAIYSYVVCRVYSPVLRIAHPSTVKRIAERLLVVVVTVKFAFLVTIAFMWRPQNHEHGICI